MKKGVVPSKSASTSACAMKIRSSEAAPVEPKSTVGLSTVLNRKTRSSQELVSSKRSVPPSQVIGGTAKSTLEKKPSLKEPLSNRYNVEDMTSRELHESLLRITDYPVEPFTFLSNIVDERTPDVHVPTERIKPTEIDLAALKRRVQLNKSLLERTNEHVKEINFLAERNSMMASRELNYDENVTERSTASGDAIENSESALKVSCPGIAELQRTIKATKDMFGYVQKICNDEIKTSDLPKELADYMSVETGMKIID